MVQPKYSPEEALQRIKLMMEYDSSKTLDENKKVISEQYVAPTVAGTAAGAGIGAAIGSALPTSVAIGAAGTGAAGTGAASALVYSTAGALGVGLGTAGAIVASAAALAVLPLVYWLATKDTGPNKVKKMFQMCSSDAAKIAKLPRNLQDTELRSISDDIEDAIINDSFGFQGGTDEEKLFGAFKKLESGTASDFCALVTIYNKNSDSGDLFNDLDSDIDAESEWKQIFRPIRNCVEDSLLSIKDEDSIRGDLSQTIIPKGWEKFPCVPTLANKSGTKIESDGAYIIGNFRYYANGRKGNITSKEKSYYTCNDPEFVGKKGGRKTGSGYKTCSEQLPIKFGCKNETIKYIQGPECLGITADGKFGPKTKQALIDKGENGNQIDSGTMIAVCKRSTSTIQPDEITLVDAEDSTKLIE